ncbi:MAG TPA: tetratricopeptide repeat protein [Drouetiella sp.]
MNRRTIAVISISICSCIFQLQNVASAESLLDEGKRFYIQANFGKAERCFEAEVKANPKDANAHYMLANTILELGRRSEALAEYQQALKLNPTTSIQSNCLRAINGLTQTQQQQQQQQGQVTPASRAEKSSPTPPTSEAETIRNAAGKIGAQTEAVESQDSAELDARIRDINKDAERQIADLQAEEASKMSQSFGYGKGRYNATADNLAVKQEYDARIQAARDTQARKIADLRMFYKAKQSAAEDTAITLDGQYAKRNQPGSVKLSPTGTSVYVRSYETADEPSGVGVPIALPPGKALNYIHKPPQPREATKKN